MGNILNNSIQLENIDDAESKTKSRYLPTELLIPENVRVLSYPYHDSDEVDTDLKHTMHVMGILVDGVFHLYEGANCFLSEPMILPENYSISEATKYQIESMIGQIYEPGPCTCKTNNHKTYLTEDNGGKAYKVEIIHDHLVRIYGHPEAIIEDEVDCFSCMLSNLLVEYEPEKIFIGKSIRNKMTEFSGGYGDKWDGNSILLYMGMNGDNYEYIKIGEDIISFSIKEEILAYWSPVGNSCVPYPYCLTENYLYDFCFGLYSRDDIDNRGEEGIDYNERDVGMLQNDDIIIEKQLFPRATELAIYEASGSYITAEIKAGTKMRMVPGTSA